MKKNKIAVHMGDGKLASSGKIEVKGDGKTETLTAKHIIVATGARARDLPFAPADGKRIWTYRHAMTPPEMPKKLLVIGSGAIGIEFASFYNDMGADVTVVEMLDRSEEHTSELQSLMRISYAVFCLKKKKNLNQ